MAPQIVRAKDFRAENVIFDQPFTDKKNEGSIVVYFKYQYTDSIIDNLRIQTPKMNIPFGISAMNGNKPSKNSSGVTLVTRDTADSIAFAFNKDPSSNELSFRNELKKLDDIVIALGIKHSEEFNLSSSDDEPALIKSLVKKAYTPILKYSVDKETKKISTLYPPSIKGKLYKNNKENKDDYNSCTFYSSDNSKKLQVDIYNIVDNIPNRSEAISIISCKKIWVISQKFGLTWIPEQIKIYKNSESLKDDAFLNESDSDSEEVTQKFNNVNFEEINETDEINETCETDEINEEPNEELAEEDDLDNIITQEVKPTPKRRSKKSSD